MDKPPNLPFSFLRSSDSNFECDASGKILRIDLMMACRILPIFFPPCYSQEIANAINAIHLVDIKLCIMYLKLYPVLKLHVISTLSYGKKAKNKIKHYISDHFQHCFRFMLHSEFATIIFIFFSWISLLCCVALT